MIRTQVQLTDEQSRRLRRLAAERGVSMAALIREGVERLLAADEPARDRDRALAVVGRYGSGVPDVSEEHDRYLADAGG